MVGKSRRVTPRLFLLEKSNLVGLAVLVGGYIGLTISGI